jgi:hypothetical protein
MTGLPQSMGVRAGQNERNADSGTRLMVRERANPVARREGGRCLPRGSKNSERYGGLGSVATVS